MTVQELNMVTAWLIDNIIRNSDIMYSDEARAAGKKLETFKTTGGDIKKITAIDLIGVIVYLHNKLHEAITGKPYNYMFHWANKIGSWVEDEPLDKCKYLLPDVEDLTPDVPWWTPQ